MNKRKVFDPTAPANVIPHTKIRNRMVYVIAFEEESASIVNFNGSVLRSVGYVALRSSTSVCWIATFVGQDRYRRPCIGLKGGLFAKESEILCE